MRKEAQAAISQVLLAQPSVPVRQNGWLTGVLPQVHDVEKGGEDQAESLINTVIVGSILTSYAEEVRNYLNASKFGDLKTQETNYCCLRLALGSTTTNIGVLVLTC